MPFSFAGVNLIGPDPDGAVQDWFDDWLPQSESRMLLDWPEPVGCFSGTGAYYTGQTLPVPNYSPPRGANLNSWYRPTGAARWSFGFFLADYPTLLAITNAIGSNNGPGTLRLEGPPGFARSWAGCYLLPPHPISSVAADPAGGWILPIVDERWYWQFNTGFITPLDATSPTGTAWSALFASIASSLGITLTVDTIPATYLRPNGFIMNGTSPNSTPQLLDAAAFSVGQRIIPAYPAYNPNTTLAAAQWLSAGWATSKSRRTANLTLSADAGGLQGGSLTNYPNQAAIAPATVVVMFRHYKNGIVIHDWKSVRYQKIVTAPVAGWIGGTTTLFSPTILSTALADYSTGGGIPDNQASLDALATQIAADYYLGIWIQDSNAVGVSQWQESGYDDFVEFRAGRMDGVGAMPSTRIHSRPYNEVMEVGLHYDSTTWEYGDKIYGTLDGNLAANGTQTITVIGGDGATPSGTVHIKVTEVLGNAVTSGTKIEALRCGDIWAAIDPASTAAGLNQLIVATCAAVTQAGSTANFTSINTAVVYSTLVRDGLCIPAKDYIIAPTDGGGYEVVNPERIIYGQFASTNEAVGNTDNFTLFTGAIGAETTTGVTVSGYIRYAGCQKNRTYMAVYSLSTSFGGPVWEIINGEGFFVAQYSSGTIFAPASPTMTLKTGTLGSEASGFTNPSVTALLRHGMIHSGKLYKIGVMNNGYEILDPDMEFLAKVETSNWAINTSRTQTMYEGTLGAETASGIGITNCYNRLQLIVVGKWIRLAYCRDNGGWDICTFQP